MIFLVPNNCSMFLGNMIVFFFVLFAFFLFFFFRVVYCACPVHSCTSCPPRSRGVFFVFFCRLLKVSYLWSDIPLPGTSQMVYTPHPSALQTRALTLAVGCVGCVARRVALRVPCLLVKAHQPAAKQKTKKNFGTTTLWVNRCTP